MPKQRIARIRAENPDHLQGWGALAKAVFAVYFILDDLLRLAHRHRA